MGTGSKGNWWRAVLLVMAVFCALGVAVLCVERTRPPTPKATTDTVEPATVAVGNVVVVTNNEAGQAVAVPMPVKKPKEPYEEDHISQPPVYSSYKDWMPKEIAAKVELTIKELIAVSGEMDAVARKLQSAEYHAIQIDPELKAAVAEIKKEEVTLKQKVAELPEVKEAWEILSKKKAERAELMVQYRALEDHKKTHGAQAGAAATDTKPHPDCAYCKEDFQGFLAGNPDVLKKLSHIERDLDDRIDVLGKEIQRQKVMAPASEKVAQKENPAIVEIVDGIRAKRIEVRGKIDAVPEVRNLLQVKSDLIAKRDRLFAEHRQLVEQATGKKTGGDSGSATAAVGKAAGTKDNDSGNSNS